MTPTQKSAMRVAIDAFQTTNIERHVAAIGALRAALAEPVVEPVALVKWQVGGLVVHIVGDVKEGAALYTSPQPPANVPLLTVEEILNIAKQISIDGTSFARAIEKAVRNKAGII